MTPFEEVIELCGFKPDGDALVASTFGRLDASEQYVTTALHGTWPGIDGPVGVLANPEVEYGARFIAFRDDVLELLRTKTSPAP